MLLRDPVHGDISFSTRETAVIDLPLLQRLRGVKQLGTASLVYPGCVHTRFDHSLGAAAVAKRMLRELARRGFSIEEELAEAVVIAALLHDVTHIPFGHTLEDERRLFPRHDKGRRMERLFAGELGRTLRRLGLRDLVAAVLGQRSAVHLPAWPGQIVSSTIDADLLDYLRRDAYFAGLAQRYDERVFHQFVIDDGQLAINLTKHGMERHDARSETEQLLRMRYFLTERVYYHHTKVAAGAMISKAVELAQEHAGVVEEELLHLTDATLFELLRRTASANSRILGLVERVERRDLLKRGYAISARQVDREAREGLIARLHEGRAERRAAEYELARSLRCDPSEVVVYCPALTLMKEAAVLVRTPKGLMPLNRYAGDGPSQTAALESNYEGLWRFYVFVPAKHARRAGRLAEERFGFPNEHVPVVL